MEGKQEELFYCFYTFMFLCQDHFCVRHILMKYTPFFLINFSFQDLKRDLQARILNVESFGGETFLSEEVAINILQETKQAFQRCQLVSIDL